MKKSKNLLSNKLFTGILFLLIGIALIVMPDTAINVALKVIGVLILIACVFRIIDFFKGEKGFASVLGLLFTLVLIVLGVICIITPGWLLNILYIVFGVLLILEGLSSLINSFAVLRKNGFVWIPFAIIAILVIILGVVIILNPSFITKWVYLIIGIVLAISGLVDIITFFAGKKKR